MGSALSTADNTAADTPPLLHVHARQATRTFPPCTWRRPSAPGDKRSCGQGCAWHKRFEVIARIVGEFLARRRRINRTAGCLVAAILQKRKHLATIYAAMKLDHK